MLNEENLQNMKKLFLNDDDNKKSYKKEIESFILHL